MALYKLNSTGDVVRSIQSLLFKEGYFKSLVPAEKHTQEYLVDGEFGNLTAQAVEAWQALHTDAQGHPLKVDGELGDISLAIMFPNAPAPVSNPSVTISDLAAKALAIAQKEVGVMEEPPGSNWGPRVKQYLVRAGYNEPEPWCASYVYWCYDEAAKFMDIKNPLPKTGYCPDLYKGIKYHLKDGERPIAGDIFFVPGSERLHHVGFVSGYKDGYVTTVEGNTNTGGSSEGIGVFVRTRKANSLVFARVK
jgi:peptidoglycan hydrolase-like protein with peptidoglycan-binding domain